MELKAGHSYDLVVSPEVFVEKTWKNGIASLILQYGHIVIDRTSIGSIEDIAYVIDGGYEYDIPQHLWKWFKEVDMEADADAVETLEKSDPVVPDEPETIRTVEAVTGPKINSGVVTMDLKNLNIPKYVAPTTVIPNNIQIQVDYAMNMESLTVAVPPIRKSGVELQFALKYLFNGGAIYQIDMEAPLSKQTEDIMKLMGLNERLEAVNHLENLLLKEKANIMEALDPYRNRTDERRRMEALINQGRNDNASRNLRNPPKRP